MSDPFTWGAGGEKLTSADRRRRIADAMMKAGMDYSPVQHWSQGAARVAQALVGGWEARRADEAEKAGQAEAAKLASAMLGSAAPASSPSAPVASSEIQPGSGNPQNALDAIMKFESGGKNVHQNIVPAGGGFNPSTGTVTGPSSASGFFQMINPTWKSAAGMAGIDTSQYPTAMSAPYELQRKAASALYAKEGFAPWAPYNASLRAHIAKNGGAGAFTNDGTGPTQAADLPAPGAKPVGADTGSQGFFIPPGGDAGGIMQPGGALPNFDPDTGRWLGPSSPPALTPPPEQTTGGAEPPAQAPDEGNRPLDPVFQSEGISQPWMGSAIQPAPPEPAAGPQTVQAPLPPARPAGLAMPQADQPAPGAVPAIGQAMPALPAMVADPTRDDAGARQGLVASEEARRGLPSGAGIMSPFGSDPNAPADNRTIFERIAAALTPSAQNQAQPSPAVQRVAAAMPSSSAAPTASSPAVERVAAAMPPQNPQLAAAMGVLNSPYANQGQRAVAQAIVERSMAPKNVQTVDLGNAIGVLDAQGNVVRQIPKSATPNKPTFGKIGVDPTTGEDLMGFIDADKGTTTPAQKPTASAAVRPGVAPAIPAAPPGANPKIWREEQTKAAAKSAAEAQSDLPGVLAKSEQTLATIDQVRKHPGRDQWGATGSSAEWPVIGGGVAGTKGRDFVNLVDQLKGKSFLEAFNGLKGGGAISEVEGAKATAAIARLDRAQSREGFDAALNDLEDVVRSGMARARQRTGASAGTAAAPDRSALEAEARRRGLIK